MAEQKKMIEPFAKDQVRKGVISYGVSSYGYDMRLSDQFKVLRPASDKPEAEILDPKNVDPSHFEEKRESVRIIPPHSFVLGQSIEYFRIPRDILAIAFGKSTYARSGVFVNLTPFEPEWEGFVTIQIANLSPYSAKVYAGEGIAQVLFLEATDLCQTSYKDKKGKYQAQKEITTSKI